jgi:two-component system, OmpR family, sensor histidine kinase MprB
MSLVTRISLLAACAVGIAVAIASLAAYVTLRSQLHGQLDKSLLERASLASANSQVINGTIDEVSAKLLVSAADVHLYAISQTGAVRSNSPVRAIEPLSPAELSVARGETDHAFRTITFQDVAYRAVTVQVHGVTSDGSRVNFALMMTQSQESSQSTIDRVGLVLLVVGGGGIIAAGMIGLVVARSALRPVRRLSAAAEHIARTEELNPIPVSGDDELASLAASFNDMLAALQGSRDRQRRLVADAGHELRTPLTSLRTNLELLAQADKRGGMALSSRQEIFEDVTAQVEELSTLVGDLVELARDEPLSRTPEPLDLADIVARAVDRVRRRAPSVQFDPRVSSWWVVGEAQILERAVMNLLDNAAKWSPAGGTVGISLQRGELTVTDDGPGVAEADMPLIFERFYRASDARTMPGSGLGLSIVRQAAERHGGSVRAANRRPHGAIFTITLPGSPYPPQSPSAASYPGAPGDQRAGVRDSYEPLSHVSGVPQSHSEG